MMTTSPTRHPGDKAKNLTKKRNIEFLGNMWRVALASLESEREKAADRLAIRGGANGGAGNRDTARENTLAAAPAQCGKGGCYRLIA
ncbi:MAG TPA: hypothetical protein VME45_18270 [Stellaceae bacterium]|nr:hypothetical protein [Stellaceae bacterium]